MEARRIFVAQAESQREPGTQPPAVVHVSRPGAEIFMQRWNRRSTRKLAQVTKQEVGHRVARGAGIVNGAARTEGSRYRGKPAVARLGPVEGEDPSRTLVVRGYQVGLANIAAELERMAAASERKIVQQ